MDYPALDVRDHQHAESWLCRPDVAEDRGRRWHNRANRIVHRHEYTTTTSPSHITVTTLGSMGVVDVRKAWAALPERFRPSATWCMHEDVLNQIRNADGAAAQVDLVVDRQGTSLMGRPVVTSSYFPDFIGTTGSESYLTVGDCRGYTVASRLGVTVELIPAMRDQATGRPLGERGLLGLRPRRRQRHRSHEPGAPRQHLTHKIAGRAAYRGAATRASSHRVRGRHVPRPGGGNPSSTPDNVDIDISQDSPNEKDPTAPCIVYAVADLRHCDSTESSSAYARGTSGPATTRSF